MPRRHVLFSREPLKLLHHVHRITVTAGEPVQHSFNGQVISKLPNRSFCPSNRFRQFALGLVCYGEDEISEGIAGIDFQSFLENRDSLIVPARTGQYKTRQICRWARKWIELGRSLRFFKSVIQTSNS